MSKYLIKTIKLPDYISSGDHIHEEDWLYVDSDNIHTINILGKEFRQISNTEASPIVRCKDCRYNYANMIPNGKGCQLNVYIETSDNWYCADGELDEEENE